MEGCKFSCTLLGKFLLRKLLSIKSWTFNRFFPVNEVLFLSLEKTWEIGRCYLGWKVTSLRLGCHEQARVRVFLSCCWDFCYSNMFAGLGEDIAVFVEITAWPRCWWMRHALWSKLLLLSQSPTFSPKASTTVQRLSSKTFQSPKTQPSPSGSWTCQRFHSSWASFRAWHVIKWRPWTILSKIRMPLWVSQTTVHWRWYLGLCLIESIGQWGTRKM